jgi:hypothetical protein
MKAVNSDILELIIGSYRMQSFIDYVFNGMKLSLPKHLWVELLETSSLEELNKIKDQGIHLDYCYGHTQN